MFHQVFRPGALPGLAAALLSTTALLPATTLAQTPAPVALPDVEVTARPDVQGYQVRRDGGLQGGATRTDTPLQDVPQSVVVIPRQVIQEEGLQNRADVLTNVAAVRPNVTLNLDGTGASDRVRGFRPEFYRDGLISFFDAGDRESLVGVNSIEVIKGPTGSLFGGGLGGGLGGIINTVSILPNATPSYEAGIRIGSYGTIRPFLDFNQPLTADGHWSARVQAEYDQNRSTVDNFSTRRNTFIPALSYQDDRTKVTLQYLHGERRALDYSGLPAYGTVSGNDYRQWVTQVKTGDGDDFLRMEGAGEYMVWAMHDPANFSKDSVPPKPADEAALVEAVKLVAGQGWPFRLHADYDETVQNILGALEQANQEVPLNRVRWIIDHAETISPRSLERVAAMGGSIAVQNRMTLDGDAFAAKWGTQAAADAPPIGRIRSMGMKLAAGTDGNRATSHNPWVSIAWLVTGRTIGGTKLNADRNLVSREEALRLWTAGAWFTGEEDRKGTLTPGKWADLAVLSNDVMTVPEERIASITSAMTMVGGRVVHGDGVFAPLAPAPLPVVPDRLPIGSYPSYAAADGTDGGVRFAAATAGPAMAGLEKFGMGCLCGLL